MQCRSIKFKPNNSTVVDLAQVTDLFYLNMSSIGNIKVGFVLYPLLPQLTQDPSIISADVLASVKNDHEQMFEEFPPFTILIKKKEFGEFLGLNRKFLTDLHRNLNMNWNHEGNTLTVISEKQIKNKGAVADSEARWEKVKQDITNRLE